MKKITRGRRFRVLADLGEGKKVDVQIHCDNTGITVWKYRGQTKYWLAWGEAASTVARRCQLKVAQRALDAFERSPE